MYVVSFVIEKINSIKTVEQIKVVLYKQTTKQMA